MRKIILALAGALVALGIVTTAYAGRPVTEDPCLKDLNGCIIYCADANGVCPPFGV